MFSNKPKPPRPDQKVELNVALGELKKRYQILFTHMNGVPETPDMLDATNENLRRSLLDQRQAYNNIKTSLLIVKDCIQDTIRVWPEGKQALSLLIDSSNSILRVVENSLEENRLWDRPNPQDNYSQNRRKTIFQENRNLGAESDKKFLAGSELLQQLTGWNLLD